MFIPFLLALYSSPLLDAPSCGKLHLHTHTSQRSVPKLAPSLRHLQETLRRQEGGGEEEAAPHQEASERLHALHEGDEGQGGG